ncbi:hypothetical protein imdm_1321 [gamma proteobacterium IMCC2047]|nr:hypothetical protein imdm_1321 [gamma proteobacterium IMCC2047]
MSPWKLQSEEFIEGVAGVHVMTYRQEEAVAESINKSKVLGRSYLLVSGNS